jgi:hypothetical protein
MMRTMNPIRGILGAGPAPIGGGGFNNAAAGNKVYGFGRPQPTTGPVSAAGQLGYQKRDAMAAARRNALIRRAY